jgi:hypothetical protein
MQRIDLEHLSCRPSQGKSLTGYYSSDQATSGPEVMWYITLPGILQFPTTNLPQTTRTKSLIRKGHTR